MTPSFAQSVDPFAQSARDSKRSLVDLVPVVPGTFPAPESQVVAKELAATPPSELNLRCQGFLTALGQAAKLRKDAAALLDTETAIDRLQTALVNEAAAATDAGYSMKDRLALAKKAAIGMLPKAKDQAVRFVQLLREPSKADAQTLANQEAVCGAVLKAVK